jgi:uncharacterized protein YjbI with pentapeptide repeats
MLLPQRALVRPRVRLPHTGASGLLEDEIRQLQEAGTRGVVAVLGPDGAGKTTALRHLRAVLGGESNLFLFDEPKLTKLGEKIEIMAAQCKGLVVYSATSAKLVPVRHLVCYKLAAWGPDDWLEYLVAAHRERCAAVMARVSQADCQLLGGLPELWTALLDRLAADQTLPDARRALHRYLGEFLSDTDLIERARSACLNALVNSNNKLDKNLSKLARPGFGPALVRALRCPLARVLLAAERMAGDLHGDGACDWFAHRLPRNLVETAALLVHDDEATREHLLRLLSGPVWAHPMSASLLHAMGLGWVPAESQTPCLAGAYLRMADWPCVQLAGADLARADLESAKLRAANLVGARAAEGVFRNANLACARLDRLSAAAADFSHADLSQAFVESAVLDVVNLSHTNCTGTVFTKARLAGADLTSAILVGADLAGADLLMARLEGADFTNANLSCAVLSGLPLREAKWDGASFSGAHMIHCDLEGLVANGVVFAWATLRKALFTCSTLPGADFRKADLRDTGLAEVEWEGADLRGADLRGASFHMGTTRSGLVGSPIASEGSRTGFYTDEYDEQSYKAPEEIRKANLCGADLRGARLEGVDFYLVDLRGAIYDEEQERLLRHCGAILVARV